MESGGTFEFPYLSPLDFTKFLLEKAPELLMGGCTDTDQGRQNLEQFWTCYKAIDPAHAFFQEGHQERKPSNTLVFALHGDEGHGAKKGNTCVISMETCLGLPNMDSQWDATRCSGCKVSDKGRNRFKLAHGPTHQTVGDTPLCANQVTNLKHNSFLTKFVLGVLPNKYYKSTGVLDAFMGELCLAFKELFTNGVVVNSQRWFLAIVGLKGDLRWYEKNLQFGTLLQ